MKRFNRHKMLLLMLLRIRVPTRSLRSQISSHSSFSLCVLCRLLAVVAAMTANGATCLRENWRQWRHQCQCRYVVKIATVRNVATVVDQFGGGITNVVRGSSVCLREKGR